MPRRLLALAGGALLAALPGPVHADCARPNLFAEADRAASVVVVRIAPGPQRISDARARVTKRLKGELRGALAIRTNPMTNASLVPRERFLLFLTADAATLACTTAALHPAVLRDEGTTERAMLAALTRWLAAPDPAARRAVLLDVATTGRGRLAADAAHLLARQPEIAAETSADARARLVARIASIGDADAEVLYGLATLLAALRAREAVFPLARRLTLPPTNARPIQDALETITGRHDPAYTPGRDFGADVAQGLQQRWLTWDAQHPVP